MFETLSTYCSKLITKIIDADSYVLFSFLLICTIVVILDTMKMVAAKKRENSGFSHSKFQNSMKKTGEEALKPRFYSSDMQLLCGSPDAVISENGYLIPIEYKPLAKKIRDRYVAQLLVFMRLIEEFEGKKPPYGYLVLGKNCRRVKIQNSESRQAWLQHIIDEMQDILQNNAEVKPQPHTEKCRKCSVRFSCQHCIFKEKTSTKA